MSSKEAHSKFDILEEIAMNRHHNLLGGNISTISQYNQNSKFIEPYHLILMNLEDYPTGDELSLKRLKSVFDSAYEAGFYLIAYGNKSFLESKNKAIQHIVNSFPLLEVESNNFKLTNELFTYNYMTEGYHFESVNDDKEKIIDSILKTYTKEEADSEQEFLSVPIASSMDGRQTINFTLGDKSKNYHAFITGISGSGKTTLLNNIILGIAQKYTSDDIRLYLMDYKEGVEFQVFKHHPNCEKIFLDNEDIQASITLLEEFKNKIKNRASIFREKGLKDISTHNVKNPKTPMPRIILIIDEVHRLFAGNYKQQAYFSKLLTEVVRQGRAFGVHIILSTQTLAGTHIDKTLMSQIGLRVSFKLTHHSDSEDIFTYSNTEALELDNYELIYNQKSGNKKANLRARANSPQDIDMILSEVYKIRDIELILKPKIVTTSVNTKIHNSETKEESERDYKYNTDNEDAYLNKLKKMGIKT